jgi:transcriptional regulator NrdR family protein
MGMILGRSHCGRNVRGRLTMFENMALRRIFEHKRNEETGEWKENDIMRSLMISTAHQILFE